MLRDLVRLYPKGSISWFGLYAPEDTAAFLPGADVLPEDIAWMPFGFGVHPGEGAIRISYGIAKRVPGLRHVRSAMVFMQHRYIRSFIAPRLVEQAVDFGRKQGAEVVLAVLNDPVIVYIATKVADGLNVPLITNVQDPPERFILDAHLDRMTARELMKRFAVALKSSLRVSTASEGMQETYRKRYGVDSVVLIHGLDRAQWQPPGTRSSSGEFTIGFAGNLYCDREWMALLAALSSVAWSIDGRQVKIRVLAPHLNIRGDDTTRIEYLGWRPVDETVSLLAQTDLTYLPYWFDTDRELFVRQCFPNKLSTYLAAGRPVFYHGPPYASVSEFLRRYPAGIRCHSLDRNEIVQSLRAVIRSPQLYSEAVSAGQRALVEELNLEVFRDRVAKLLGTETALLAGPPMAVL